MQGVASGGGNNNYGVFGVATGATGTNYAGYFQGSVFTTGTYQSSDAKLKENINDEANAMSKLMLLRPVSYKFKQKDFPELNLPKEFQHGLIAQEVEKVFPEMVGIAQDLKMDKNGQFVSKGDIKAVNYTMLIPLMIKALQEQQEKINNLEKMLNNSQSSLTEKNALSSILNETSSILSQNSPNPFSQTTLIRYNIPQKYTNSSLVILDMTGKMLMKYDNLNAQGQIIINAGKLLSGIYLYSLYNRNEEILTKKMIISK